MLHKILNEKWKSKSLGHFYLVESHQDTFDKAQAINQFVQKFLIDVLVSTGKTAAVAEKILKGKSHPDIFYFGDEQESSYKVEELNEFFSFNELAPFELKHKFIIFHHAHLLTQIVANKLLKVLEEPNKNTTIFLLNPRGHELLPTIRSRAIKLKLPWVEQPIKLSKDEETVRKVLLDLKQGRMGVAEAMESLKNCELETDEEILRVILQEKTQGLDFAHQRKLLEQIQWMKKSDAYHNSLQERVFSLLEFAIS